MLLKTRSTRLYFLFLGKALGVQLINSILSLYQYFHITILLGLKIPTSNFTIRRMPNFPRQITGMFRGNLKLRV